MARMLLSHLADGTSTWRRVPGTKEEMAAQLVAAQRDGEWLAVDFDGRESAILNPAAVIWVQDD